MFERDKHIFSTEQLDKWGILEKAKKEKLKDDLLAMEEKPTTELIESIINKWRDKFNLESKASFQKWLENANFSKSKHESIILRNWMWLKWCEKKFESNLFEYFLIRKKEFLKVTYSIIKIKNKNIATELYIRIKEGEEPFWKMASKFSEGDEKFSDGKVGPLFINELNPYLRKLIEVSNIGQLWPPKQIDNWWIIFKLEKKKELELKEEVKNNLLLELGEKYLNKHIINNDLIETDYINE